MKHHHSESTCYCLAEKKTLFDDQVSNLCGIITIIQLHWFLQTVTVLNLIGSTVLHRAERVNAVDAVGAIIVFVALQQG